MNNVLQMIRSNIFSVIFVVVAIGALVGIPLFASKLSAGVTKTVEDRARQLESLKQLATNVEVPGSTESQKVLVNEQLVGAYRTAVESMGEDVKAIYQEALKHNEGSHSILMDRLFPEPPGHLAEVLPHQFHGLVVEAYKDRIEASGAGSPPDAADVATQLQQKQRQLLAREYAAEVVDTLDDEQREDLEERLAADRLTRYQEHAHTMSVYLTEAALDVPAWNESTVYPLSDLFEWQWDLWIVEDVLAALTAANASADSVVTAPVKRISRINVEPIGAEVSAGGATGGGAGGMGLGMSGGGGSRGARGGRGNKSGDGAAALLPINPAAPIQPDYTSSLTGRVTNGLFDVRMVNMTLQIDPLQVGEVLDAFARQNLITVVDLQMDAADPFEGLEQGYFYGSGSSARLWLRVETLWLREWTKQYMPAALRTALKIAPDPPKTPVGADQT